MALTDADRLQMTMLAIQRHNVMGKDDALLKQPTYTHEWPVPPFDDPDEELSPMDNVSLTYSYTIE
jgi:hypothetical protein